MNLNIILIFSVFVLCLISIKNVHAYAGQRTCFCEVWFENKDRVRLNHITDSWKMKDFLSCGEASLYNQKQWCENSCIKDNIPLKIQDANEMCRLISYDEKLKNPYGFDTWYSWKYSDCTGWNERRANDRPKLQCPRKCNCKLSKTLATSYNPYPNFDDKQLILNAERTEDAYYSTSNSYYDNCIDFCERKVNELLPVSDIPKLMNEVCKLYSYGIQTFDHGFTIHKKQSLEGNTEVNSVLVSDVCCNPVCKCSIKFKSLSDSQYVLNKEIKLTDKIPSKPPGYKCKTNYYDCISDCRKAAASYLSGIDASWAISTAHTPDLNILTTPTGTSSAAATQLCNLFGDLPKPGVAIYLETDTDTSNIYPNFPRNEKTHFGNLCCKHISMPEYGINLNAPTSCS